MGMRGALMQRFATHAFRYAASTERQKLPGVTDAVIQELMGWSDSRMIRNYRDRSKLLMDVAMSKRPSVLALHPQIHSQGNVFLRPQVSQNVAMQAEVSNPQRIADDTVRQALAQSEAGGGDGGRYRTRTCDLIRVKDAF